MFFIIEADNFLYSINHHFTCLKQRHIYILFLSYYDIFLFSACVQCTFLYFVGFLCIFYIKYILLYSFNQSTIICTLSFFISQISYYFYLFSSIFFYKVLFIVLIICILIIFVVVLLSWCVLRRNSLFLLFILSLLLYHSIKSTLFPSLLSVFFI